MRKTFYLVAVILFYGCSTGLIKKETENILFEKFPISNWNNGFEGFNEGKRSGSFLYKGVEFYPTSSNIDWFIYIYPQKKQFYTYFYQYDEKTYNLIKSGKILGWNSDDMELKIGIWYEFDSQGKPIKKTDEDKKFGKFSYNELLLFLDKEKLINLREGLEKDVNRDDKMDIVFYNSDTSYKKLWKVFVYTGKSHMIMPEIGDIGEKGTQPGKTYFIDGNTGEVIKRNKETLDYYKEIGFD